MDTEGLVLRLVTLTFLVTWTNSQVSSTFPARKTWWAKQITPFLYTAGRLTDTQIKQATDAGFKTIVSQFTYTDNVTLGSEVMYDTPTSRVIAMELAGLTYDVIMEAREDDQWDRAEKMQLLTQTLLQAPKPILYYCTNSELSSFLAINFLINQSRNNPEFENQIDENRLIRLGAALGYDFNAPRFRGILVATLGANVSIPVPTISDPDWFTNNMWILKPVHNNTYIAGQIKHNYLPDLQVSGFRSVVNSRRGVTTPPGDTPSQEEVTLLNIRDRTGTYTNGGRQSDARLRQTVIDPNKPNDFIKFGSAVNYESRNPLEFGDDVGYNETMERRAVEDMDDILYHHTPLEGELGYNLLMWNTYKDRWVEASHRGKVLFHCRSGWRASVSALLTAGHRTGLGHQWALTHASYMGYNFESATDTDSSNVVQLLRDILVTRRSTAGSTLGTTTGSTACHECSTKKEGNDVSKASSVSSVCHIASVTVSSILAILFF